MVKQYIEENRERFLEELFELLRIPSVSAQSVHKGDMVRAAEWLRDALLKSGADRAEVMPTEGNPVVFAEKIIDRSLPTVLVYGHYDVMPEDPVDEWRTEPFEPVVKEGRIWCRGADDDKGQLYMHAKAFEALVATGQLPCNVKFMLEGEEEIGSGSLYKWCEEHRELVKADIILVSDTSLIAWDTPSITCGLRGLCYMQVEVTGPDKDLHSGLYGGAVANPANVLADMIAKLVDADGHIAIPGFYDDVRELSDAERRALNSAPFDVERYKKSIDIPAVQGEKGYTTAERTGVRPSLDVNGIWGGYIDRGNEDHHPFEGFGENIHEARAASGLSENRGAFRELFPQHRSGERARGGKGAARRPALCVAYRPAGLPCRREGHGGDFRKDTPAVLFGWQHPDNQRF